MIEITAITKRHRYAARFHPEHATHDQAVTWLHYCFPRARIVDSTTLVDSREPWVRAKENGQ